MPLADLRLTLVYFALAFAVIVVGLVLRFAPLGLPFWLVKYGGSVLWAVMVYLLFAALLAHQRPFNVAAVSTLFATAIEVLRLYHTVALDAFRLTLAGALLLGRAYSNWHLLCYWVAITLAALLDQLFLRPKLSRRRLP